jgi:hypothetical protein
MYDFALIGDVHSQSSVLKNAIEYCIQNNLTPIFLGDLFDSRSSISNTVEVYNLVRKSESELGAICLQSNHQDKLIRYLKGHNVYLNNGLDKTVKEFSRSDIKFDTLLEWLESRPYGVVFKDSSGVEYRCAHAYFSSRIEIPEYSDYHLVYSDILNRKLKSVMIYGPVNEEGRVNWWDNPRKKDYVMVSGHYHKMVIKDECLILDGECGDEKDTTFLPLYDVNKKVLRKFYNIDLTV